MSFSSRLKSLIHFGSVSRETDDADTYPVRQVTYMGKPALAMMLEPYGLHANVPAETLTLLLNVLANPDAKIGIPSSPVGRPAAAKGEVVLFHPGSSAKVHLREDEVEVSAAGASIVIDPTGAITITPVTGLPVTVDGNLIVTETLTVAQTLAVAGATTLAAVTAGGKDIGATHVHSGVTSGASNTGVPV